jgi:CBS domain-containing protein
MKIKDRIEFQKKSATLTFKANDKLIDAVRAMSDKNYGASVIVDDENRPVGIITERDLMRRVLYRNLDANTTLISEVMTTKLKLASEEDDVLTWLSVMSNERFRHLPVVDKDGKLVNLMSQGDFVSYTWPQLLAQVKDNALKLFMKRFHLHLIFGAFILYALIIFIYIRLNGF